MKLKLNFNRCFKKKAKNSQITNSAKNFALTKEFELKEKFKLNGENVKTNDINRLLEIYENGDIKQQVISYT